MNYERIYEYRFKDVDHEAKLRVWREISSWLYKRYGRPVTVLDPAAGMGEFIATIPASERWAVDQVDHGLSILEGVNVQVALLADAQLPEAHFDLIFVSNLLEHLPSQEAVAELLGHFRSLVRPRGRIVVMGPNFRYCTTEYFDCADHVTPLTDRSTAEHLYGAGFRIEEVIPRFLPFSFRSKFPASPFLTRTYLRSPLAWRLLGRQFLISAVVDPN
jgi:2-polyprenyl-3-methyl-5-hydroxy-6-metoxy-1,4-benzoquinol methylase